jgi:hypothetical protein
VGKVRRHLGIGGRSIGARQVTQEFPTDLRGFSRLLGGIGEQCLQLAGHRGQQFAALGFHAGLRRFARGALGAGKFGFQKTGILSVPGVQQDLSLDGGGNAVCPDVNLFNPLSCLPHRVCLSPPRFLIGRDFRSVRKKNKFRVPADEL